MNNKGQVSTGSTVSHVLLWVFIIVVAGYLVYSATHSKSKTDTFTGQSKQLNTYHIARNYSLMALSLVFSPFNWAGCDIRKDKPVDVPETEETNREIADVKVDNSIINAEFQ